MDSVVVARALTVVKLDEEEFLLAGFSGEPRSLKLPFLATNMLRFLAGSCNELIGGMDRERERESMREKKKKTAVLFEPSGGGRDQRSYI